MNHIRGPVNDVERRYTEDATFRHVVDALHAMVARADLTPSEIRQAAMLACIHYEMRNPAPLMVKADGDIVPMTEEQLWRWRREHG